ncbi:MAG: hypothetical protein SGJ02_00095 [bacterium]|nr:hypothetical protein [bacterium]
MKTKKITDVSAFLATEMRLLNLALNQKETPISNQRECVEEENKEASETDHDIAEIIIS